MGVVFGKITVETPAHQVVHTTEKYQIWRYPPRIAATVYEKDLQLSDEATESDFTSAAFRRLARYIGVFGKPENVPAGSQDAAGGETIAMTAPVDIQGVKVAMTAPVEMAGESVRMTAPVEVTESDRRMSFFLPARYESVAAAPVPTNKAVKLVAVPTRHEAVVTFSGNLNMRSSKEKADVLTEELKKDGVEIVGAWTYCGYNPPYTLPWMKRNEIHVPVDGTRFAGSTA